MNFTTGQRLLIDKPKGWTSFDVVKKLRNVVRQHAGQRVKVGHAGTLDPLATGLLILCTGPHTKQIETYQELPKIYEVCFKLGATTPSYDSEFPEEEISDTSHITEKMVEDALMGFRGEITQMPPLFSAVKIDGKRAYKAARKGKSVKLRPRQVRVYDFELMDWEGPGHISARIKCGKGTYIRSLIHDLGQDLGVGGYIRDLRRMAIGEYRVEDAWQIPDFVEAFGKKL